MFKTCCRCCLTNDRNLVSLATESNHKDNKNLLDYLNIVLGSSENDFIKSSFICLRCSKALQVAYHFINLYRESEEQLTKYYKVGEEKPMGNPIVKETGMQEIQNCYVAVAETRSYFEIRQTHNKFNNENQFRTHINNMDKIPMVIKKDLKLQQSTQNPYKSKTPQKDKELNNLKCNICHKQFENKNLLDQHNNQKMHKEYLPFKCKLCNFYSCYSESLFKHYKNIHGLTNVELKLNQTGKIYNVTENPHFDLALKCLECDFGSPSQTTIDEHLLKEHFIDEDKDLFVIKFYNCPACHRSFKELKSARTHYTMCHNNVQKIKTFASKKYACDKCGKLFHLKLGLHMHKRKCEPRDPVNCNFCELQYSSVLKYEQHLQTKHSVDIKHECEICDKSFNSSEFLAIHRKRHNERYYQCDLCPKNYINNAELKVHKQRMHHRNVQKSCGICGKTFAHLSLLRNHEIKEHVKNYLKCAYCEFKSHSKFAKKVHQYKHTGKPYKCKLCTKEFVLRKDIKRHCQLEHSVVLSNQELAEMFKQSNGYVSRFDAFSKQNNNLLISEINELEIEEDLKELGLTLKDIMEDLFDD